MSSSLSPGGYVRQGQRGAHPPRSVNVQVAVRCRPLNDREKSQGERSILQCDPIRKEVILSASGLQRKTSALPGISSGKKTFTYDHVFGMDATQADVFERVVEPIVDEVLEGYNCTVFAYGQTGTGKTHTMEGRRDADMVAIAQRRLAENAGIIPRSVKQIFDHLRSLTDEHSVRVSHLELYNEQLSDLLGPDHDPGDLLRVYEDPQKGTFVQGLEDVVVRSEDEIFAVLDRSAAKRKTAETLMNKYSSRSHSIFSITIHIKQSTPEGADLLKVGKLNLVDLAGSENVGRSGAVRGRAREAGNINQSLLTLGRVITALVDRHPHVPYRDSKLTRLLQESLGGRNKTCVIATVTPGSSSVEETASTLDYAYRAKSIKNRPTVNQMIAKHVLLKEYTEEISRLKRELNATREKNGVYLPPDEFEKLQNLARQQREEINSLETRSEEYEKRLGSLKDKLANTQDALQTNQDQLKETQTSLHNITNELVITKDTLAQTIQQRNEYSFLTRSHVATEERLYDQGRLLQKEVSVCVSEADALHTRVEVMSQLEKENQSSLTSLKKSVAEQVSEVSETLRQFTGRQFKSMDESRNKMEDVANCLNDRLSGIENEVDHLLQLLKKEDDEHAASVLTREASLQKEYDEHVGQVTKNMSSHSSKLLATKKVIEGTCHRVSESVSAIAGYVSEMKASVERHSSAQVSELNRLAKEQHDMLQQLGSIISESLETQSSAVEKLQSAQQRDSEMEQKALHALKDDILANITLTMNELIGARSERITNRNLEMKTAVGDICGQFDSIRTTLQNHQESHAKHMAEAQEAMKSKIHFAEREVDELSKSHAQSVDSMSKSVAEVLFNTEEVATSLDAVTKETNAILHETRNSVLSFREQNLEQRKQHTDTRDASVQESRQGMLSANAKVADKASKAVESLGSELKGITDEAGLLKSEISEKVMNGIQSEVEAYNILCDDNASKAPKRREWPKPVVLARTPNHEELLAEFRTTTKSPEVPIDNICRDVALNQDIMTCNKALFDSGSRDTSENGESRRSSASYTSRYESGEATETSTDDVNHVQGVETSSEKGSVSEIGEDETADSVILIDTTNRRESRRRKRNLDQVSRKRPTGIPLPRGRSHARKLGGM